MNLTKLNFFAFAFPFRMAEGDAGGAGGAGGDQGGPTFSTVADQSQASSSQTATVPVSIGQAGADTSQDFRAGWTDDLKNDPGLKDFKDTASMAKALLEANKKSGATVIPGPDATPEEKAAFSKAMGVPDDAAGYEFKAPDNLPEALKANYDQAHADKWAGRMKELGVPKEVANTLRNEFFAEVQQQLGEMKADVEKSDADFAKMANSIFGDQAKANKALTDVRGTIEKYIPAELKASMSQMSNSSLLIVAAAIHGAMKDATGEDTAIGGGSSSGQTASQLREEARALIASEEYSSPFSPKGKEAHEKAKSRVKEIYAQIGNMK